MVAFDSLLEAASVIRNDGLALEKTVPWAWRLLMSMNSGVYGGESDLFARLVWRTTGRMQSTVASGDSAVDLYCFNERVLFCLTILLHVQVEPAQNGPCSTP
jgi:hypothetical protein